MSALSPHYPKLRTLVGMAGRAVPSCAEVNLKATGTPQTTRSKIGLVLPLAELSTVCTGVPADVVPVAVSEVGGVSGVDEGSGVGPGFGVTGGKRLAMPPGAVPPFSSFLAMPGGRS